MKRRILSALLTLCLMLSLAPAAARAVDSGACGSAVNWTLDDDGELTISGSGAMEDYDDDENASPWYEKCGDVVTVTIEAGVTSIGKFAFYNCTSLASVTIPEGVESIGESAFYGCTSLARVNYGGSTAQWDKLKAKIGSNNDALTIATICCVGDFTIERGTLTKYIGPGGVVTIPANVKSIGNKAFSACISLESVTIPAGVESIGEYAFGDCFSLTSVTISDGVKNIGCQAFYNCAQLTSVEIPTSVESIGGQAFASCGALTAINVSGDNQSYASQDGVLFNKNKTALI